MLAPPREGETPYWEASGPSGKLSPVGPVVVRVRSELRHRWLNWLALACLIGVFAGGVTAIAAGARRTDSAYSRLVHDTRAPDIMVVDQVGDPDFASYRPRDLAALPQVTWADQVDGYTVLSPSILEIIAPTDRQVGVTHLAAQGAGRPPPRSRSRRRGERGLHHRAPISTSTSVIGSA